MQRICNEILVPDLSVNTGENLVPPGLPEQLQCPDIAPTKDPAPAERVLTVASLIEASIWNIFRNKSDPRSIAQRQKRKIADWSMFVTCKQNH